MNALTAAALVLTIGFTFAAAPAEAQQDDKYKPKMVPRGEYVRQGFNAEGTLIVGYRTANSSVGQEWMLLDAGFTVFPGNNQQIRREQFALETPDGTMIPMATQTEAQKETATLKALNRRADIQREPINYFPAQVQVVTPMSFFANPAEPGELPFDEFGASAEQARVGRLFFKVPGGIQYGKYFLHLKMAKSQLVVPINIMTKEELKEAKKAFKEFEKEQKRLAKEQKKQGN
jgi:hypothetical protein